MTKNSFDDPALFASTWLKILDKQNRIVPLVYNRAQRHYLANRTGRDIILKARQLGFSTMIQAEMFRCAVTASATTATLSHKSDSTDAMRRMSDRFFDNLPEGFRPSRTTNNKTTTTYDDFNSVASIFTSGGKGVGHSLTTTHQHWSEVPRWNREAEVIEGMLEAGTPRYIVAESTPNGQGGWFYDECMAALDGSSAWKLHFYPWWWDDGYRLALEPGERLVYDEEEARLVVAHGLAPEQIKWRRSKILAGGAVGGAESFSRQYPEDPKKCFLMVVGLIYPNFAHDGNVRHDLKYDPLQGRVIWGCDDGYTNERAVLVGQETNAGGVNILYEYAKSKVPDHGATIQDVLDDTAALGIPPPDLCYVDASAAQFRANIGKFSLSYTKGNDTKKWNVENGLAHTRALICDSAGVRMVHIHSRCKKLIGCIQSYRTDDVGQVVKVNDHLPDALRYMCKGVGRG